jgi:hypothetical protein
MNFIFDDLINLFIFLQIPFPAVTFINEIIYDNYFVGEFFFLMYVDRKKVLNSYKEKGIFER